MMEELIIDEKNFAEYFKDIATNKPTRGDLIACYTAKATLTSGDLKQDIINSVEENVFSSVKILQKMAKARYLDAIKVIKEIVSDRLSGLSKEEVENKEYSFTAEFFYYTKKEYVPTDDPHWSTLKIHNIDEYLDNNTKITSKIIEQTSK